MFLFFSACIQPEDICKALWYYDGDGDGFGDPAAELAQCDQPAGYVDNDADCDDGDAAIADSLPWYLDEDADGFGAGEAALACEAPAMHVATGGDCDNLDAEVHPGADESCNELDDDCDGDSDEDPVDGAYYLDEDGDGAGVGDLPTECSGARTAGDCDDLDSTVNPAAAEHCGGVDEDCDGDASANAVDQPTWYLDEDADGYGVSGVTDKLACDQPEGYAAAYGDCDDTDPAFHPAATETCDDPTDYDCDGTTTYADADADGWAACTDCDDARSTVNPDAIEVCDEIDNDCDGETDPDTSADAPAWYADGDGDGEGAGASVFACDAPSDHVAGGGDCDDADPDVTTYTWYLDGDDDGWGAGEAVVSCDTTSPGFSALDGDCDDARADVSPSATETCDGADADEDCDGLADDDDDAPAETTTMYQDGDGDGYGSASTAEYCDTPVGWSAVGDDCDDADADVNPAASEVCDDGIDQDCDGTAGSCVFSGELLLSDASVVITSSDAGYFGYALATIDHDGDGRRDLVVSNVDSGVVLGFYAPLVEGALTTADADWDSRSPAVDQWGRSMANAGSLDGGEDHLIVTAPAADSARGEIWLTSSAKAWADSYSGDALGDYCGISAGGAGDGDADGLDDFAYGCPSGTAPYVVWRSGATRNISSVQITGSAGAGCGYGVGELGDADGDGYDDLGVGCTGIGTAYVVFGPPASGAVTSVGEVLATASTSASVGQNVVGGADFDGDGYDDAVVSAHDEGQAWLYAGAADRSLDKIATFDGPSSDRLGGAVLLPGDLNGDEVPDMVLSAMGAATSCHSAGGAAFLFYAPVLGTLTTSDADGSLAGCTSAGAANSLAAGDLDDDGTTDLVVGEYGNNTVYGLFGSGI